ncbi:hypothetical protein [Nonomuraea basaltis]|uniref:hypothetical protein n=1 Tax=Nonomuraea basaltis TaxID=2495887 RepID=UPI00110C57A7|nr:hypothetical protein [Nonomuraea basaltis]TMR94890.1 hypothetical protein EJK15_31195 [Nonomuraea basaltis]
MKLDPTATATPLENLDAWTWGWDAVVALGTLSLAGFTVRLAARTRELAQQSAADLRAQWRPVLLPAVPSTTTPDPPLSYDGPTIIVRIRNAGRGPAIHVRAQLDAPHAEGAPRRNPDQGPLGALAVGDEQTLKFRQIGGLAQRRSFCSTTGTSPGAITRPPLRSRATRTRTRS